MNYPRALTFVLGLTLLTACPPPERPSDPEPGPADGDTGGVACEDELAVQVRARKRLEKELEAAKAELAECMAPK